MKTKSIPARSLLGKVLAVLALVMMSCVVSTESASAAEPTDTPRYELVARIDGSIKLTVTGAKLTQGADGGLVVTSSADSSLVYEVLGSNMCTASGKCADMTYMLVDETTASITYVANSADTSKAVVTGRGYWGCVGKNTGALIVGGAVGGCATGLWFAGVGCAAGAGSGAVFGAIGGGISSLISCI